MGLPEELVLTHFTVSIHEVGKENRRTGSNNK